MILVCSFELHVSIRHQWLKLTHKQSQDKHNLVNTVSITISLLLLLNNSWTPDPTSDGLAAAMEHMLLLQGATVPAAEAEDQKDRWVPIGLYIYTIWMCLSPTASSPQTQHFCAHRLL